MEEKNENKPKEDPLNFLKENESAPKVEEIQDLIHYKDLEFFVKKHFGETRDKFDDVFETVEENEKGEIRLEDFKKEFDKVWEYH